MPYRRLPSTARPGVPGARGKSHDRLAELIVDERVRCLLMDPDELYSQIHKKLETEKQSVTDAFDIMLKEVIDQSDRVKNHIFAEIDEVEHKVRDHIEGLCRQLQIFNSQADSIQKV